MTLVKDNDDQMTVRIKFHNVSYGSIKCLKPRLGRPSRVTVTFSSPLPLDICVTSANPSGARTTSTSLLFDIDSDLPNCTSGFVGDAPYAIKAQRAWTISSMPFTYEIEHEFRALVDEKDNGNARYESSFIEGNSACPPSDAVNGYLYGYGILQPYWYSYLGMCTNPSINASILISIAPSVVRVNANAENSASTTSSSVTPTPPVTESTPLVPVVTSIDNEADKVTAVEEEPVKQLDSALLRRWKAFEAASQEHETPSVLSCHDDVVNAEEASKLEPIAVDDEQQKQIVSQTSPEEMIRSDDSGRTVVEKTRILLAAMEPQIYCRAAKKCPDGYHWDHHWSIKDPRLLSQYACPTYDDVFDRLATHEPTTPITLTRDGNSEEKKTVDHETVMEKKSETKENKDVEQLSATTSIQSIDDVADHQTSEHEDGEETLYLIEEKEQEEKDDEAEDEWMHESSALIQEYGSKHESIVSAMKSPKNGWWEVSSHFVTAFLCASGGSLPWEYEQWLKGEPGLDPVEVLRSICFLLELPYPRYYFVQCSERLRQSNGDKKWKCKFAGSSFMYDESDLVFTLCSDTIESAKFEISSRVLHAIASAYKPMPSSSLDG